MLDAAASASPVADGCICDSVTLPSGCNAGCDPPGALLEAAGSAASVAGAGKGCFATRVGTEGIALVYLALPVPAFALSQENGADMGVEDQLGWLAPGPPPAPAPSPTRFPFEPCETSFSILE